MIELRFQDRDPDGAAYRPHAGPGIICGSITAGRRMICSADRRRAGAQRWPSSLRILRIELLLVSDLKPDPWKVEERTDGDRQGPTGSAFRSASHA
jgi:hypothetical protein